jgi:hypothetical protein
MWQQRRRTTNQTLHETICPGVILLLLVHTTSSYFMLLLLCILLIVLVPDTASYIRGLIQRVLAPNDLFSWNNKYNKYIEYNITDAFTSFFLAMHTHHLLCACWHLEAMKGSSSLISCRLLILSCLVPSLIWAQLTLLVPALGIRSHLPENGAPIHRVRAHSLNGIRNSTLTLDLCIQYVLQSRFSSLGRQHVLFSVVLLFMQITCTALMVLFLSAQTTCLTLALLTPICATVLLPGFSHLHVLLWRHSFICGPNAQFSRYSYLCRLYALLSQNSYLWACTS